MPINDDTKVIFSSSWSIEQILSHNEVTISTGAGAQLVSWASLGINYTPRVIVSWKDTSDTRWQMSGASNGVHAAGAYMDSTGLWFQTDTGVATMNVRYTIYKDKSTL